MTQPRTGQLEYNTRETQTRLKLNLDGFGRHTIATGIGFLDHMLAQLSFHGLMDLDVATQGDLAVDSHHTAEDVGIALGRALAQALGDKSGIRRFAHAYYPMDETLVRVALDCSGRPELVFQGGFAHSAIGGLDTQMIAHFFKAVALNAGLTLHMAILYGDNDHHKAEALFKAFARALADAAAPDPRRLGVASTKGTLSGVGGSGVGGGP